MTYEEIAQAREALAQKLSDGTLKPFDKEYSGESSRLDQLSAACRLRSDQQANERHAAQVAAAIDANKAVTENQAKMSHLLGQAARLVSQGDATIAALHEVSDAIRGLSPIGMAKKLVELTRGEK